MEQQSPKNEEEAEVTCVKDAVILSSPKHILIDAFFFLSLWSTHENTFSYTGNVLLKWKSVCRKNECCLDKNNSKE